MGVMSVTTDGVPQWTPPCGNVVTLYHLWDNVMVAAKHRTPHQTMYRVCNRQPRTRERLNPLSTVSLEYYPLHCFSVFTRGAPPRVLGRQLPLPPPPPPLGASGQQFVANGAALTSPWAPKAPDAPWGGHMGTKATQRKVLSTLHPSTILKPNPDPKTHPNPQPSPNPTPSPTPTRSPKSSPSPNLKPNQD